MTAMITELRYTLEFWAEDMHRWVWVGTYPTRALAERGAALWLRSTTRWRVMVEARTREGSASCQQEPGGSLDQDWDGPCAALAAEE